MCNLIIQKSKPSFWRHRFVNPSLVWYDTHLFTFFYRAGEGSGDPTGVTFSPLERSSTLYLSRDQRTATCTKGYRMVKATHGVQNGKWYCEFQITPDLKPGAHVRYVLIRSYLDC